MDAVLVRDISRLGRDTAKNTALLEQLNEHGVQVITLDTEADISAMSKFNALFVEAMKKDTTFNDEVSSEPGKAVPV